MDQTATALNQQSHIELPEKMSSLCEMLVKEIATLTLLPTSFAICGN